MFLSYRHKVMRFAALLLALLFAYSQHAHAQTVCTLSANPPFVASGQSAVLTATCIPTATSYEWTGGNCSGMTSATCTVNPSVTTSYSVLGIQGGSTSQLAKATVFTEWSNDGIYQWSDGQYLSLHRIAGDIAIATIYLTYPSTTVIVGSRAIPDTDTFDLFNGKIIGSKLVVTGTRFFRACNASYDLDLSSVNSITVNLASVSNSSEATAAGIDCLARYGPVGVSRVIPVIKF